MIYELNQQSAPDFENQVGQSLFIEIQDNPSLTEPNICKNPDTLNSTINKEDDKQKENVNKLNGKLKTWRKSSNPYR